MAMNPRGILGLMDFVRELERKSRAGPRLRALALPDVQLPPGTFAGTRESASGVDFLNREFWRSSGEPEGTLVEKEIAARQLRRHHHLAPQRRHLRPASTVTRAAPCSRINCSFPRSLPRSRR
jgi:hypothetical protein